MATIAEVLSSLPRRSQRYRNAAFATFFLSGVVVAADLITSHQIKSTGYFKYGLKMVRNDPRVVAALGSPVEDGLRVSTRRRAKNFELEFSVTGPKGSARVRLASIMDPTRPVISKGAFKWVLVEPHEVGGYGPILVVDNR